MTLTALMPAEKVWLTSIAGSEIAEPSGCTHKAEPSQLAERVICRDLCSVRAGCDIALV